MISKSISICLLPSGNHTVNGILDASNYCDLADGNLDSTPEISVRTDPQLQVESRPVPCILDDDQSISIDLPQSADEMTLQTDVHIEQISGLADVALVNSELNRVHVSLPQESIIHRCDETDPVVKTERRSLWKRLFS